MDLKEFIKNTINSIEEGINSSGYELTGFNKHDSGGIEFNLSVTVENNSGTEGGGKITILGNSLGGKIDNNEKNINVSQIKFKIDKLHNNVYVG